MPSRTTPVIPGSRISWGWMTRSQIEVPTTIRKVPGCSTPAPGTDTNESTLPTATVVDSASPIRAATSARSGPAGLPSWRNVVPSFSAGCEKPG